MYTHVCMYTHTHTHKHTHTYIAGESKSKCIKRKLSSVCAFENVIYTRDQAHAHIAYHSPSRRQANPHSSHATRNSSSKHDHVTARDAGSEHGESVASEGGHGGGTWEGRGGWEEERGKGWGWPSQIHLVHQLQCCPQYHAQIQVRTSQRELDPSTCDVYVHSCLFFLFFYIHPTYLKDAYFT